MPERNSIMLPDCSMRSLPAYKRSTPSSASSDAAWTPTPKLVVGLNRRAIEPATYSLTADCSLVERFHAGPARSSCWNVNTPVADHSPHDPPPPTGRLRPPPRDPEIL